MISTHESYVDSLLTSVVEGPTAKKTEVNNMIIGKINLLDVRSEKNGVYTSQSN